MKTLNRPCELGMQVGEQLVKFVDEAEKRCAEELGFVAVKCPTCAFREGTIPNGCLTTVATALKCSMENEPFYCHHKTTNYGPQKLCAGWLMMDRSATTEMPFDYPD